MQPAVSNIQLRTIINNNNVLTGSGTTSVGIGVLGNFSGNSNVCASVFDNKVTGAFPGTNRMEYPTRPGPGSTAVNVDNLSGNVAPNILINGNVNFIPQGTCESTQIN